eukprot:7312367-Lingulodinium_polyedra.AAC.1
MGIDMCLWVLPDGGGQAACSRGSCEPPFHPELSDMERGHGDDKCVCAVVASHGARICQGARKP